MSKDIEFDHFSDLVQFQGAVPKAAFIVIARNVVTWQSPILYALRDCHTSFAMAVYRLLGQPLLIPPLIPPLIRGALSSPSIAPLTKGGVRRLTDGGIRPRRIPPKEPLRGGNPTYWIPAVPPE